MAGMIQTCCRACLCVISGMIMTSSCRSLRLEKTGSDGSIPQTGSSFYQHTSTFGWKERDALAIKMFESGLAPKRFLKMMPVTSRMTDSTGKQWKARLYVTQDYFMVGNRHDFARVPLTPMAAQRIADITHTALPTRRIVDLIHHRAQVRLEPVPCYAHRDSTIIMRDHDLIIEGQRQGRNGLISGIKKDVVLCSIDALKGRSHRVAIYGWHRADGKPIQPLYTGHIDWYVDYSHGIRLIDRRVRVNGQRMDYQALLNHPALKRLVTDETGTMLNRY